MTRSILFIAACSACLAAWATRAAAGEAGEALPAIEKVQIGESRELRVNGRPFFPIMSWLQEPKRYGLLRSVGINTFCGNHRIAAKACLDAARAAGGYGVYHFDANAVGDAALLAWIHGDEPDLPRTVYDAKVTAGATLKINRSTPLERMFDGVMHSWSVLDPMVGAEVSVELPKPITVRSVAVWQTISPGLSVAKDVVFLGDGKELLKAALEAKKGRQPFELPAPATFRTLTLRVVTAEAGKNEWGSIGEVEALDAEGRNVLLSPPRTVPRQTPEQLASAFARLKAADASRPVFVTFTAYFMKEFDKYDDAARAALYGGLVKSCDVVGYDIYPIYGWNKPEWLPRVAEGVTQLRAIAGERRPVYAWIETCKGSQWVSYDQQKDVLPAHTRAEVWMAILRGATAIGYFTHAWKPAFTEFNCTPEMQAELKRLNGQITRLTGAILAPQAQRKMHMGLGKSIACHIMATSYEGATYLFAQSLELSGPAKKANFVVEGLKAGAKIEVMDEGRTITAGGGTFTAGDGAFTDDFLPLQEHIYRIPVE